MVDFVYTLKNTNVDVNIKIVISGLNLNTV